MKIYILKEAEVPCYLIQSNIRCTGNGTASNTCIRPFDETTEAKNLVNEVVSLQSSTCCDIRFGLETSVSNFPNVRISMDSELLSLLQNEYKHRLRLKLELEFKSALNNTLMMADLELSPPEVVGYVPNVFTIELEAPWLYNHLQKRNIAVGTFTIVADIAPTFMSPLLDFQASYQNLSTNCNYKIVLENGVEVLCNRERLEAISPVFSNLLSFVSHNPSTKLNLETSVANIINISEKTATTFSKILNNERSAINVVLKDPNVGLELFDFAHELMMEPLVEMLKGIFIEKLSGWDVDIAIQLYCSFRVSAEDEVKVKAMEVIKRKWIQLNSSFVFQDLLYRYPERAIQLYVIAIQE